MKDGVSSYLLQELQKRYTVREEDIGRDARLRKFPLAFDVKKYTVEGIGNLCLTCTAWT